jgi:DNA-binding protein HU-beta
MAEITSYITEQTGYAEPVGKSVLEALGDFLGKSLRSGESVTIKGLGTFSVKDVPARKGRNPQTGETIEVPAKKKPTFKFSLTFKDSIQANAPLAPVEEVPAVPATPVVSPTAVEEEVPPPPLSSPVPPIPKEEGQPNRVWHVNVRGKAVKKEEKKMKLKPDTLVYGNGYQWTKASEVAELSYLLA